MDVKAEPFIQVAVANKQTKQNRKDRNYKHMNLFWAELLSILLSSQIPNASTHTCQMLHCNYYEFFHFTLPKRTITHFNVKKQTMWSEVFSSCTNKPLTPNF